MLQREDRPLRWELQLVPIEILERSDLQAECLRALAAMPAVDLLSPESGYRAQLVFDLARRIALPDMCLQLGLDLPPLLHLLGAIIYQLALNSLQPNGGGIDVLLATATDAFMVLYRQVLGEIQLGVERIRAMYHSRSTPRQVIQAIGALSDDDNFEVSSPYIQHMMLSVTIAGPPNSIPQERADEFVRLLGQLVESRGELDMQLIDAIAAVFSRRSAQPMRFPPAIIARPLPTSDEGEGEAPST